MEDVSHPPSGRAHRILLGLRLIYTEIQYWFIGLTPEGYHSAQASAWEGLGNFRRAAGHLGAYLDNSENPRMRAQLAYYYSKLERWSDAADEYSRVIARWPHPSVVLCLAQVKLQLGEVARANELLATVEASKSPLEPYVESAMNVLKSQLSAAVSRTNVMQDPNVESR